MRVTNSMMSSRMLLNIHKNMRNMDKLWNQMSTTKKVSYPSDDPILASRALKFRTMVSQTEQYQRNVAQGLSWMEVTEYAIGKVTDVMTSISELNVQGASDQLAYDDRQKIANNIEQYMNELSNLMLGSYAGRFVFSGYRTDQPTTYQEAKAGDKFSITQSFAGSDIEKVKSYQKLGATQEPLSYEVNILKLAYTGTNTSPPIDIKVNNANQAVTTVSITSDQAYLPGDDDINYIPETGELVLGKNVAAAVRNGAPLEATYAKEGFAKGEPNPRVYFPCIEYSAVVDATATPPEYDVIKEWNTDPGYTMDDHMMRNEFGVGMTMEINALGKDILTDKLFADLRSIVNLLRNVELSDETLLREHYFNAGITDETALNTAVADQLTREKQRLTDIIQTKYSNFIGIVQKSAASISTQHTGLGTRMTRLELISERLVDDRYSYKKLMSDNEDIDPVEISYLLNEATAVYNASLQAGSNIIQLTLANFIR